MNWNAVNNSYRSVKIDCHLKKSTTQNRFSNLVVVVLSIQRAYLVMIFSIFVCVWNRFRVPWWLKFQQDFPHISENNVLWLFGIVSLNNDIQWTLCTKSFSLMFSVEWIKFFKESDTRLLHACMQVSNPLFANCCWCCWCWCYSWKFEHNFAFNILCALFQYFFSSSLLKVTCTHSNIFLTI